MSLALLIGACGDINSSWEVKGGGYLKYTVNGNGPYSIDLAKNDVEPPFYVNNSHHYFYFCSQIKESKRGDQIVTSGYSSVFPPGILVGKVGRTGLAQGYHDLKYGFCFTSSYMPPIIQDGLDPDKESMVYMPEFGHHVNERRLLIV